MARRGRLKRKAAAAMGVAQLASFNPQTGHWEYPGLRATNDPALAQIHQAAERFWQSRGVGVNGPSASLWVANDLGEAGDESGRYNGRATSVRGGDRENRIMLDGDWAGRLLYRINNARDPKRRRDAVRQLYGLIAHEEGHVRGLPHTEGGGLMYAGVPETPGDWHQVARQVLGERYRRVDGDRRRRRVRRQSRAYDYGG